MLPKLSEFECPVFFTGAGLSVESGIPTYRGQGGLWHEYNYEDYACQAAFNRDPNAVWDFHDLRRQKVSECAPNDGHKAIADVCQNNPAATVVTQNIDGLHQRSGVPDDQVFELHGSLWRVRVDELGLVEPNFQTPLTPRQHESGHFFRPDIVWFGDNLKSDVVHGALEAIRRCDVLVSIGTSAVVYPAAEFPLQAKRRGAVLIEVNPEETPLSAAYDHHLRMPATEALQKLLDR